MARRTLVIVTILVFISANSFAYDRITGKSFASRSEVIAPHGMVATSHPLVTQIALDVLKDGGTAVDAAIAADAALGLMEPTGSGIGGDLFAIVWDGKTKQLYGVNGSGRSPKSLTRDMLVSQNMTHMPSHGPLPVTVPGCVDGWFELHGKFGKLPMKRLLAPTIGYAKEGFPLPELIAYYWGRSVTLFADAQKFPNFKETYTIEGRAPRTGEIFKNPALAKTYALITQKGREGFYEGVVAQTIETFMREQGGYITRADLAAHHGEWVDPVSTNYRGYDVWELPPNTQGVAALEALNILEGYDFSKIDYGSADHIHLVAESLKLAFEDAARYFADPAFAPAPLSQLTSKAYAAERRALIDPARAAKKYEAGGPFGASDTVYLTVADANGTMISLIQSNYRGMGSGMVPPGLGFMLQDRGEAFDLTAGRPNTYAPHKRPFHTIIPGFVTRDGEPLMAFGVMGGDMQPQGHVQVLVNLIDFGMNLQEAGDAPRMYHTKSSDPDGSVMVEGGEVNLEPGFGADVRAALEQRGHRFGNAPTPAYGGYQAV